MTSSSVIPLSIAPMMQWTDRHWRYFMRLMTKETLLYTEMIMDHALMYNTENLQPFLGHSNEEHPLAVQLGGSNPDHVAEAAYLCEGFGSFEEINLNSGCPSNKAKKAGFGAELMLEPELVRQIVYEMKRKVARTTVSVKCRLGVTGREEFGDLLEYLHAVKAGGVNRVILHARHCVLKGLSPAQNRNVPPLHPELVHRLVGLFPDMQFILNGGLLTFDQSKAHLSEHTVDGELVPAVHGVMVGREAYNNPYGFRSADQTFFKDADDRPAVMRGEVLEKYLDYAVAAQEQDLHGSNTCTIVKPLHNFFTGCEGNFLYKQTLDNLIQAESKLVDSGKVRFDDLIWRCVHETMPEEVLWTDHPGRPRFSGMTVK